MTNLLSQQALSRALMLTDLTDPNQGAHAIQQIIQDIAGALQQLWPCRMQLVRSGPVVSIRDNYDRLGYPTGGASREERYTRYVTEQHILRTQTSAAIPDLLAGVSIDPPEDLLWLLPGLVYRRDCIDRLHCGEPHQLDLWRIVDSRQGKTMTEADLQEMITAIMRAVVPEMPWRTTESPHPYTEQGVQIDVQWRGDWIEVGECGLASRAILRDADLPHHTGLAMGLGLDRLLMLCKGIPDIRLLRSRDPRVVSQMRDLSSYQPVSKMPAVRRDLSLCVDAWMDEETIGDRIREVLPMADCIEAIRVKSSTAYAELPESAHQRMGMQSHHKNVLLEVTIRHMERTLTDAEANAIRNQVYRLLHQGQRSELAENSG